MARQPKATTAPARRFRTGLRLAFQQTHGPSGCRVTFRTRPRDSGWDGTQSADDVVSVEFTGAHGTRSSRDGQAYRWKCVRQFSRRLALRENIRIMRHRNSARITQAVKGCGANLNPAWFPTRLWNQVKQHNKLGNFGREDVAWPVNRTKQSQYPTSITS